MSPLDLWATGLRVPPRWVCRSEGSTGGGVAASARPAGDARGRPELRLWLGEVNADAGGWRRSELAGLAAQLPGFDLEDEDVVDLDGQDVDHVRYARRAVAGGSELLSERWAWWSPGAGLTVTGTVARAEYAVWCETFEAVVATVDPTRLGVAVT